MLIEPNDWTNERAGGYLLNEVMRGHDMVRRGRHVYREKHQCFSEQDSEGWLSTQSLCHTVAEALWDRGIESRSLSLSWTFHSNKPFDIDTNKDARQSYKRECAEVYNRRADSFRGHVD